MKKVNVKCCLSQGKGFSEMKLLSTGSQVVYSHNFSSLQILEGGSVKAVIN